MANELLYMPGIGTRFYYSAAAGSASLDVVGSDSWTSALEDGHGALSLSGGTAFNFSIPGMSGSHTIEYWIKLTGWANTGTSHQWGYIGSRNLSYELWRPKAVSGTNNINMQLDFETPDPEDTTVSLSSQNDFIHVAEVFDTSDSNYQLKMYVNGTKVKQHYFNMPWANALVIGGHIDTYGATAPADGFTGKISDVLVTSGVKYTDTFTPARPSLDLSGFTKGGNPIKNFTAPEINYLEIGGVPYKIAVAS